VKQMREKLNERKEQWTLAELLKMPAQDVAKNAGAPAANPAAPANAPATQTK
jgi:hypothetical protein